jgi:hypothetical protein
MFGIFAVFSAAILAEMGRQRILSMFLIALGLLCTALMMYHHGTDVLKINW